MIKFEDLTEVPDRCQLPWLDRFENEPTTEQGVQLRYEMDWWRNGVVVLEKFLPEELMDRYDAVRSKFPDPRGWGPTPYMYYEEIKHLCLYAPLSSVLKNLIGAPMGLHLNLTGYISTERAWHQDTFLNPPHVGGWYVAVWMALEDISPDSGPFQYVPGSHKWPELKREKVLAQLTEEERRSDMWPTYSERILTPLFEEKIKESGLPVVTYLPKRGDVLIWHSRLTHQGSKPNVPGAQRKAIISHYSAITHRHDMPDKRQLKGSVKGHNIDGYYFHIERPLL